MTKNKIPLVSIIIPVKTINDYLVNETIPAILKQTYKNYEIYIIPDKSSRRKFPKTKIIPSWPKTGPADKRDLGAAKARGEILAFLDDDSYPDETWLESAVGIFNSTPSVAAVCGPTITPPQDAFRQKAGGYVWSTILGSGGAGTYRYTISSQREVDDFPTANLLVRKKDFWKAGGFNTHFWSGEDTKLCWSLTQKLGKKIIYHPQVLVYHHRREIFGAHLEQICRYALHRGHFARIMPQTSFRIGYISPSVFALGLLFGPILAIIFPFLQFLYLIFVSTYFLALLLTTLYVYYQEKDKRLALMVGPTIFLTHFVYGIVFIFGFFAPELGE